jgi:two-component system cell cycle response regulator
VHVVDDSPSVRKLLGNRLRAEGHEVDELADAESAVQLATGSPPDVVVTDLLMSGLSGVQLCRLLRSDPATAHVPVILLTASGDKRSRFWARSAGAAAYVVKDRLDDVIALVARLSTEHAAPAAHASKSLDARRLQDRISGILDDALFESVVSGELRSLASAGDLGHLFERLVTLTSDVLSYRWLAVLPERPYAPLFVHGHEDEHASLEAMARAALTPAETRAVRVVSDARAVARPGAAARVLALGFAGTAVGRLAVAPTTRGFSREDDRLFSLLGAELGGALEMTSLYEDARRLATTDALTGLLNRRAFMDALDRERARSDRHTFPVSLLLLDVDHFKSVNDRFGHATGDAVLQAVARALLPMARRSDVVARWGGEEFVVLLPQTRAEGARIAAERIRRAIANVHHGVSGSADSLRITASIGASSATSPWSADGLVATADHAMYVAKSRGRNRVEVAVDRELDEASTIRGASGSRTLEESGPGRERGSTVMLADEG